MATSGQPGFFHQGSDGVYRCIPFEQFDWLDHGFSTRNSIALPSSITTLRQVHSALVHDARGLLDRSSEGDALISDEAGRPIGVRTADCVPVLLVDGRTRAVAAIHAGWRGTAANICGRTAERMAQIFQTNPVDLHAAIGPAIGACCYEVGFDVAARFANLFPERTSLKEGSAMLDLAEANRRLLVAAGVPAAHVYSSGLCTFCNSEDFFSYRRDQAEPGRMISFASRLI